MRPPLGIGGLGECVSLSVSFSHRRVGSSILASLSEAGGNDPFLPVSGPLPPHVLVGADRVGTRPTHGRMQVGCPNCRAAVTCRVPIFNDLAHVFEKIACSSRTDSEPVRYYSPESVWGALSVTKFGVTFAISPSYSLSSAHACCIMEGHSGLG